MCPAYSGSFRVPVVTDNVARRRIARRYVVARVMLFQQKRRASRRNKPRNVFTQCPARIQRVVVVTYRPQRCYARWWRPNRRRYTWRQVRRTRVSVWGGNYKAGEEAVNRVECRQKQVNGNGTVAGTAGRWQAGRQVRPCGIRSANRWQRRRPGGRSEGGNGRCCPDCERRE